MGLRRLFRQRQSYRPRSVSSRSTQVSSRPDGRPSRSTGATLARVLMIGGLLGVGFFILSFRLFWVQVVRHGDYKAQAIAQQEDRVIDPGLRGDVLDRNGNVLLRTLADRSLTASPAKVRQPRRTAERLAEIIERPAGELEALLRRHDPVVEIQAHLPAELAVRIESLELAGICVTEPGRRMQLVQGCELLGDLNRAGDPVEGIERTMDAYLRSEDGWFMCYRSATGHAVQAVADQLPRKPPRHGDSVVLTIDSRLQWMAEDALERAVEAHSARSGSVVLVDVWTGEILALAGAGGGLEPGRRVRRLRPIEDLFEPGSTFKIAPFVAAIDLGLLDDDSVYYAEQGQMDFGGFVIRDVKKMGWLCSSDVLAQSSNICTAKIGEEVGARHLHDYARALGFGQRTLVELPGEQAGILRPVARWSGRSAATVAIGQEVSVTTLQLAMAYAAVANGGELLKPRLIREVRRRDGTVRWSCEREVVRRAMRPETAAVVGRYMARAVAHGTGRKADPGVFPVAGKTGTAQKALPGGKGYAKGCYISTFAGYFPADDPQIVAVVVIDEPQGAYYGGEVAAPVFADLARGAASLAAGDGGHRAVPPPSARAADAVIVPDVRSMSVEGAVRLIEARGLEPTVVATGPRVIGQDPAPGAEVQRGLQVTLEGRQIAEQTVPDVVGLTLREALRELRPTGLEIKARGRGVIVQQVPLPGTLLEDQGACRLVLASQ